MERFTIGKCRTGKTITSHPHLDGLETIEEIFDAFAALSILAAKEYRRDKHTDIAIFLVSQSEKLYRLISADQWDSQMKVIGARTSFDIRRHGEGILRPEFRD